MVDFATTYNDGVKTADIYFSADELRTRNAKVERCAFLCVALGANWSLHERITAATRQNYINPVTKKQYVAAIEKWIELTGPQK